MSDVSISRHQNDAAGEYHAHVTGSDLIGRLTWVEQDGVRIAEHTIVPTALGGRGIAAKLVEALVADAREQGFRIRPVCSYVAKKFDDHPEWADLRA